MWVSYFEQVCTVIFLSLSLSYLLFSDLSRQLAHSELLVSTTDLLKCDEQVCTLYSHISYFQTFPDNLHILLLFRENV